MQTQSRMTLANIRNNGLKIVLALMLVGGPLATFSMVQTASTSIALGSDIDDVDPG